MASLSLSLSSDITVIMNVTSIITITVIRHIHVMPVRHPQLQWKSVADQQTQQGKIWQFQLFVSEHPGHKAWQEMQCKATVISLGEKICAAFSFVHRDSHSAQTKHANGWDAVDYRQQQALAHNHNTRNTNNTDLTASAAASRGDQNQNQFYCY